MLNSATSKKNLASSAWLLLAVLAAGLCAFSGQAMAAKGFVDRMQLKLKGTFAFGGEYEGDTNTQPPQKIDDDAEPSLGVALQFEYPILRYFTTGVIFGYTSLQSDDNDRANIDRSHAIDIEVLLRGRYPMLRDAMELYLAFPLGVSINIADDELEDRNNVDYEARAGFVMSVLVGVQYIFFLGTGAFVEMGVTYRQPNLKYTPRGGGNEVETDLGLAQFQLNFGIVSTF